MRHKQYYSQRTRAAHTYRFYKQRRNDPNRRADFLEVQAIRRRQQLLQLIGILAVILVGVIGFNRYRSSRVQRAPAEQVAVAQSADSSDSESRNSQESAVTSTNRTTTSRTQTSNTSSTEISDYQRFAGYSGTYQSAVEPWELDFNRGRIKTLGAQKEQIFYFDKVIQHPDDSLVINVHANYHYNAYDGKGEREQLIYQSILFAPAGKTITKNWQTGTAMRDRTDSSANRFAIADSNDGGKTFVMTPAYQAFAENRLQPKSGESAWSTVFVATN